MFSSRLALLAQRRRRLQHRIAQQRAALAAGVRPLLPALTTIDTGRSAVHWARNHPALSFGAMAMLVVLKPRFAFRWGKRALLVWQTLRRVRKLVRP